MAGRIKGPGEGKVKAEETLTDKTTAKAGVASAETVKMTGAQVTVDDLAKAKAKLAGLIATEGSAAGWAYLYALDQPALDGLTKWLGIANISESEVPLGPRKLVDPNRFTIDEADEPRRFTSLKDPDLVIASYPFITNDRGHLKMDPSWEATLLTIFRKSYEAGKLNLLTTVFFYELLGKSRWTEAMLNDLVDIANGNTDYLPRLNSLAILEPEHWQASARQFLRKVFSHKEDVFTFVKIAKNILRNPEQADEADILWVVDLLPQPYVDPNIVDTIVPQLVNTLINHHDLTEEVLEVARMAAPHHPNYLILLLTILPTDLWPDNIEQTLIEIGTNPNNHPAGREEAFQLLAMLEE